MAKRKRVEPTAPVTPTSLPTCERVEEFVSEYANNVRFEATVYDLKLLFGESDLGTGGEVVMQHTAITVPWTLVKLMVYYLRMNLVLHELYNGAVTVPPNQIPMPFPSPSKETIASDPKAQEASKFANRLRDEFIGSL